MDDTKFYEIGGKKFYQRKLGLFQLTAVTKCFVGVTITGLTSMSLLEALGDRLAQLLNVVLIPEGMSHEDFIEAHETPGKLNHTMLFKADCGVDEALEVLEDFLAYNRVSSVVTRLASLMETMMGYQTQIPSLNGSSPSSAAAIPAESNASVL